MNKTDKTVYDCMLELNRPCSVNCVQQKLVNTVGKPGIQSSLDNLVKMKKITVKAFGKQKIYVVKQDSAVDSEKVCETLFGVFYT